MTVSTVSLPKVPAKSKKVTEPAPAADAATAAKPEVIPPKAVLTYGEAIKLVAGVLRHNENSPIACEAIRDIVDGTGLSVRYEEQQEEEGQEEG